MGLFSFLIPLSVTVGVFAIFVLGLNLKWGFAGLLDIGHVAYLSIGAYATVILNMNGLSLPLAVLAGIILAGLAGGLLGFPALRLKDDYLAIVTLGFAEILNLFIKNEDWLTKGTGGLIGFDRPFEGLLTSVPYSYLLLALVIAFIIIIYFGLEKLVDSPWGRVLKSIREDEVVTAAMGKNVFSYKVQSLALGSAIAGLAGALLAFKVGYIHPTTFEPMLTFYAWIAVVLGGSADNRGAVIGTIIVWGVFRQGSKLLTGFVPLGRPQVAAIRIMIIGIILMFLMRFKPEGILGNKEELSL